ncbi:MAG TPA: CBS domain-containing protein [Nitrosopumilaceae archaeon]|nr:CBS domain-containing protein [Nitrosopumilaceae archaeon]
MASTFVKDIMKKIVITIDESMSIQEAAQKMVIANVGCVIVTRKDKPVGIITERDFVTKVAAEGRPLFTEISELMSLPLVVIDPDETVWEAAEIMKAKGIHKLPVQEGNKIVGIVTTTDLVKICSLGSDSQMRNICDQILMRMKPINDVEAG